jgi:predicted transcriptional regulator
MTEQQIQANQGQHQPNTINPVQKEHDSLNDIHQSQQKLIEAQNTLILALERVIKAHQIKDESFRMLDEAYRTFDESNRLLDEAYRNREAAEHPIDKANRPIVKEFRSIDEAYRHIDEAFRRVDEAFRRRNEAKENRKDSSDAGNTVSENVLVSANQEKSLAERVKELSGKVKKTAKLGETVHSDRIAKRIAQELLLIKQQGKMRVSELRKQLALNRSALQRDVSTMMKQKWIDADYGPMYRVYFLTEEGNKFIEQEQH